MEKDPSEGWYQGEIGFFDFYVIPLAKKVRFGATAINIGRCLLLSAQLCLTDVLFRYYS